MSRETAAPGHPSGTAGRMMNVQPLAKAPIMDINLLIGGKAVPATGGATYARLNPVTGGVATRAAAATVGDAEAAALAAAEAFPAWSALGPSARRTLLLNAAARLDGRAGDFATAMLEEIGATPGWAHFNVGLAAGILREAAAMTTQIHGEVIPSDRPGTLAMGIRQPAGVRAGNCPLERPGDLGHPCSRHAVGLRQYGGVEGIRDLPGDPPADRRRIRGSGIAGRRRQCHHQRARGRRRRGRRPIAHPAVRRVNFTGSTKVGRIIAEVAGRH